MKISTKGRYGIRLMLSLALAHCEGKGTTSLKAISEEQNISEKYLEQIINPLTKQGFTKSFRGAHGGYAIAKDPADITVGEILRVLEGSLSPVDCVENNSCPNADACASATIWRKINTAVADVVDGITLADLINEHEDKIHCILNED